MESWSNKCAWLLYSQFIPRAFTLMFHYLNKSTFDFVSWAWRIFFQCVSSWRRLTNQRADGRVLQMKVSDTWAVNRLVLIHLLKILCTTCLIHLNAFQQCSYPANINAGKQLYGYSDVVCGWHAPFLHIK